MSLVEELIISSRREFIKQSGVILGILALPSLLRNFLNQNVMEDQRKFDVIIIGGSYSGLAAGMALGRALRKVLIIDSNLPCNRQTPFSHNFLTHDGSKPNEIAALAKQQVESYSSVKFIHGLATNGAKTEKGFEIGTDSGKTFIAKKLVFATGIKDVFPSIEGFAACWGISVLHCPYCHGYEVRNEATGILGNGDSGFELAMLISNWTNELSVFTNEKSAFTLEQTNKLKEHNIIVFENKIEKIEHSEGKIQQIVFKEGGEFPISVLYAPVPFVQHCTIPGVLGCEMNDAGYINTDSFQKTNIAGVYACGDSTTRIRTIANAVSMGTTAGMMLNKEIVLEEF